MFPNPRFPPRRKHLRNGDIVCIVTTWPRGYTSHVGIAYRDKNGVLRLMHASKNAGEVIVDSRLSTYLKRYRSPTPESWWLGQTMFSSLSGLQPQAWQN